MHDFRITGIKWLKPFWINEQNLIKEKFSWQTGYAAYSVSQSALEKTYQYIANQKQHHEKMTFAEEYDEPVKLHGLQKE